MPAAGEHLRAMALSILISVIVLEIDLIGDGSVLADVGLCRECARRFGRVAGEVVSGADSVADRENPDEEGKALPWICPVCPQCLKRWTGRTTRK